MSPQEKGKNIEWLLDHPRELIKQFDDLTDSELQRLIEMRDRRREEKERQDRLKNKERDDAD